VLKIKRLTEESGLIMGYDIIYEGKIKIDKPLDDRTYEIIKGLAETRRMIWDTKKLESDGIAKEIEIGFLGEYFFGIEGLNRKQKTEFENKYVIDHNRPPYGQPSLWGVWTVTDDKMELVWNRNEKAYCGHEWLQYIVKTILVPRGYKPSGIINWFTQGEYWPKYHTIVEGNSVRKYKGYNKKQKEPDRKAWYDELSAEWEEYHQDWLKKLIENKVEFLHEREDYINKKSILSFNLYIGNDIVQVCFDRMNISEARYLYRNLKNNDGVIKYDEVNYDEKIEVDINTQNQAMELIEKYITENPNFLNDSII
jgi:hypothetical protein